MSSFVSPYDASRAHGVVVSHPLSMREALGSIPSVSIFLCVSIPCQPPLHGLKRHSKCEMPVRPFQNGAKDIQQKRQTWKEATNNTNTPDKKTLDLREIVCARKHKAKPAFSSHGNVSTVRSGRSGPVGI